MAAKKRKASVRRTAKPRVRLLLTCIGRRVELLRAFEQAGKTLGIRLDIHVADASRLSPAMHLVEHAHQVPPVASGEYLDALESLVQEQGIDLLIPLLDVELLTLAAGADRLAQAGCRVLISRESVVRACRDKINTHKVLKAAGIDTPDTWTLEEALALPVHRFPYFLKPRSGSAAMGNFIIRDLADLHAFGTRVEEPLVQEFVAGVEHTLDVYTGLNGVPRCVVPRKRLEVRTGEVSKGLVVKNPAIMNVGRQVAETLQHGRGVITVQCIVTPQDRIRVIEINPRFGGGVPLAIHAGADFPAWILAEHLGKKPRIRFDGFRDDVAMLRYDESVFVERAARSCGLR